MVRTEGEVNKVQRTSIRPKNRQVEIGNKGKLRKRILM